MIQSSFFSHYENITNLPAGFFKVIKKTTDTGHNKPFFYYLKILFPFEIGLLIINAFGLFYFKKNNFSKFLIYWSLASFSIFSLIPYKTNWVVYVLIFPLFLLSGSTIDYFSKTFRKNNIIFMVLAVFFAVNLFFCIEQNFIVVNDLKHNKIGYVETTTDIFELRKDIHNYIYSNHNTNILITSDNYWPIPIFLDNCMTAYKTNIENLNLLDYPAFDIFIVNQKQFDKNIKGFKRKKYQLRNNYFLNVFFKY